MLQKAMLDGMRLYINAAFLSVDIFQDQVQGAWAVLLDQNGKIRSEVESAFSTWMLNARQGREGLQKNLEKGLSAIEQSLDNPDGGHQPLSGLYTGWSEMQIETMQNLMGIWGFPPQSSGGQGEKDKSEAQAAKTK
jgi:hypothetical protein